MKNSSVNSLPIIFTAAVFLFIAAETTAAFHFNSFSLVAHATLAVIDISSICVLSIIDNKLRFNSTPSIIFGFSALMLSLILAVFTFRIVSNNFQTHSQTAVAMCVTGGLGILFCFLFLSHKKIVQLPIQSLTTFLKWHLFVFGAIGLFGLVLYLTQWINFDLLGATIIIWFILYRVIYLFRKLLKLNS